MTTRYFRRAGPDTALFESMERSRSVRGPQQPSDENPNGVPGEIVAYHDDDPIDARMMRQLAADTANWYEVDARGNVPAPRPLSTELPPEPEAETEPEAQAESTDDETETEEAE